MGWHWELTFNFKPLISCLMLGHLETVSSFYFRENHNSPQNQPKSHNALTRFLSKRITLYFSILIKKERGVFLFLLWLNHEMWVPFSWLCPDSLLVWHFPRLYGSNCPWKTQLGDTNWLLVVDDDDVDVVAAQLCCGCGCAVDAVISPFGFVLPRKGKRLSL